MKRTRFVAGAILALIFTLFVGPSTVQLFAQGTPDVEKFGILWGRGRPAGAAQSFASQKLCGTTE